MKEILRNCPKCGTLFNAYNKWRGELKFCSRTCANSRGPRTDDFKQKVSKKLTGRFVQKKIKLCVACGNPISKSYRKTCSDECAKSRQIAGGSIGGKTSAQKQVRRSKQEIELYDLCKNDWNVTHNQHIIDGWDADIILPDHKIAVLWNGPWHYKQMPLHNHSLKQVQTRDMLKQQVLKENGWTVLVFNDSIDTPTAAHTKIKLVVLGGIEPPTNGL